MRPLVKSLLTNVNKKMVFFNEGFPNLLYSSGSSTAASAAAAVPAAAPGAPCALQTAPAPAHL